MAELIESVSGDSAPLDRNRIPLMLVDDHDIWRSGVRAMLDGSEFDVVAEARTEEEALPMARLHRPLIVLLDIRLPDGNGLDVLARLQEEFPEIVVVMLTTYESPIFQARALAGGASGYLLKGVTQSELLDALRQSLAGVTLLNAHDFVRSLHSVSEEASRSGELFQPLSHREEEVLRLVATGLSNREIATVLFISPGTVKSHIEHILNKLGVADRVQLAVWAARNGLVPASSILPPKN